jgi:hypothetical protein
MAVKRIATQHHATFDSIRHVDGDGNDHWLARPLAKVLDDSQYRHFLPVVEWAREACRNSGQPVLDPIEEKLRRDQVPGKAKANKTPFEVGRKVRQTIRELGRTMPEHLPQPDTRIQHIASAKKRLEDKKQGPT